MAVHANFEDISRVVLIIWLVLSLGSIFLITLEGRRLGRLIKTHYPSMWHKEYPFPRFFIMDQQYMGFILQRKYRVIEEEKLVIAYEQLRTRLVRTMTFVGIGFILGAGLAFLFE